MRCECFVHTAPPAPGPGPRGRERERLRGGGVGTSHRHRDASCKVSNRPLLPSSLPPLAGHLTPEQKDSAASLPCFTWMKRHKREKSKRRTKSREGGRRVVCSSANAANDTYLIGLPTFRFFGGWGRAGSKRATFGQWKYLGREEGTTAPKF